MLPLLAIAGANIATNMIQPVAARILAPGQPKTDGVDQATFQKLLANKIASSPEAQKASFMSSEGIRDTATAQQRLGDYGTRIMQDPGVRKALAGNTGAVEMRFSPDGTVSIKTASGQQKSVALQGDAKVAAQKAARILSIMQSSPSSGMSAPAFTSTGAPQMPGIKITPGGGAASVLA